MSRKFKIIEGACIVMEYGIDEERIGAPSYKVDEIDDELINALAKTLDMEKEKIKYFTEKMGLAWLNEPSIIGVTQEQLIRINDLTNFLRRIDR